MSKIGLEDMIEMLMEDWIILILLHLWGLIVNIDKKPKKKKNNQPMTLTLKIRLCLKFKIAKGKW